MNSQTNNTEIHALINLLDDPDEEVIKAVSTRISELGLPIVASLEKAWETTLNIELQQKIENIIQKIQFNNVKTELNNWNLIGGNDLLMGATIIARYQYPEIKYELINTTIEKIKNDVWLEINDNLTALEKVKVINHILYNIHGFSGNFSHYYAPHNYFINQVLETHKGNPVTLGIIYITIAKMLNLPIQGVNLPKNFILAYTDVYATSKPDSVLFYINPYNKGAVLGKREIDYFLQQQNIQPNDLYYYPCNNFEIIVRLIRNLISSFESTGQANKIKRMKILLEVLGEKS